MRNYLACFFAFIGTVLGVGVPFALGLQVLSDSARSDQQTLEFDGHWTARLNVVPARFVVISLTNDNFQAASVSLEEVGSPEVQSHLELSNAQKLAINRLIDTGNKERLAAAAKQINAPNSKLSDVSTALRALETELGNQVQEILLRPQQEVLKKLRRRRAFLLLGWEAALEQALRTQETKLLPQQKQQLKELIAQRRRDVLDQKNRVIQELNQKAFEQLSPDQQAELQSAVYQWDAPFPYPFEFFVEAVSANHERDPDDKGLMARLNMEWTFDRLGQVKQNRVQGFLAAGLIHSLYQIGQIDAMETQMNEFWEAHRDPSSRLATLRREFQSQSEVNLKRFAEGALSYAEMCEIAIKKGAEYEETIFEEFQEFLLPFQKPLVEKAISQLDVFNRSLIGSLTEGELARVLELDRTTRDRLQRQRAESATRLKRELKALDLTTRRMVFEILTAEQIRHLEETFQISDVDADTVHHPELMLMPRELDLISTHR